MPAKLENYIGLMKRSNSLIYGFDNIKASKKCYFVLIGNDCNEKLENRIKNICVERGIKYKKIDSSLNSLLSTKNCSVVGVINKNFVNPIMEIEE